MAEVRKLTTVDREATRKAMADIFGSFMDGSILRQLLRSPSA